MAGNAFGIVGIAMTTVTAGRINLTFYLVPGHEIAAMYRLPVRPVPEFHRRLDLDTLCMAIRTKRLGMTDRTDLWIPACRILVFVKKIGCMVVDRIRLLCPLELGIQVTVGAERFPLGQRFFVSD
jgi:hypothetical protein